MTVNVDRLLKAMLPRLLRIRHYIHQHPEIRYKEFGTAALVERELRSYGVEAARVAGTGVIGLLRADRPGGTVALRADMDALEMAEETGLPYASANGCMHACGHDGHTAILLGAARLLAAMRSGLRGRVKFIFQPAEELGGGARVLCEAGVMKRPRVDAIFAQHGLGEYPAGSVAVAGGAVMAACDSLSMTVEGRGAHAAHPHLSIDPILVSARIIDGLQTIASREIEPIEPVVVTVGTIQGGFTSNIIPRLVRMTGTIRTVTEAARQRVFASIRRIAARTAAAHGARCRVRIEPVYPATVNDPAMTELVRSAARAALGPARVGTQKLSMGAEDFSFYLEHAPGCFWRLGLGDRDHPHPTHSSRFDFNDKAIAPGVKVMVAVARTFLASLPISTRVGLGRSEGPEVL